MKSDNQDGCSRSGEVDPKRPAKRVIRRQKPLGRLKPIRDPEGFVVDEELARWEYECCEVFGYEFIERCW
jgi:hypothetical protein